MLRFCYETWRYLILELLLKTIPNQTFKGKFHIFVLWLNESFYISEFFSNFCSVRKMLGIATWIKFNKKPRLKKIPIVINFLYGLGFPFKYFQTSNNKTFLESQTISIAIRKSFFWLKNSVKKPAVKTSFKIGKFFRSVFLQEQSFFCQIRFRFPQCFLFLSYCVSCLIGQSDFRI